MPLPRVCGLAEGLAAAILDNATDHHGLGEHAIRPAVASSVCEVVWKIDEG